MFIWHVTHMDEDSCALSKTALLLQLDNKIILYSKFT